MNENDATATDEITFGDNDALAAHVAILVRARLLVLLTEVDGVFTRARNPGGKLVHGDPRLGTRSSERRRSSAVAACVARWSRRRWLRTAGIPTVIAGGVGASVIAGRSWTANRAVHASTRTVGSSPGTRSGCASESLWRDAFTSMRAHTTPSPRRDGACSPSGVVSCEGHFDAGDAVELVAGGEVFLKGIVGAPAAEIAARPRDVEAIHRDRLVLRSHSHAGVEADSSGGVGFEPTAP